MGPTGHGCTPGRGSGSNPARRGGNWLLLRRNDSTGEIAYYRAFSPRRVPLTALVAVAGQRWRVEESFQTSKGLTGLDQHQVRRWTSWHRWTTLAMLAHAFLTVVARRGTRIATSAARADPVDRQRVPTIARRAAAPTKAHHPADLGLVHLETTTPGQSMARARASHYRARAN